MSFVAPQFADHMVRLQRLLEKGEIAQHQSEDHFDWAQKPRLPLWLPKPVAAWAVSQFMHGELATAAMCSSVVPRINCPVGQAFLRTQYLDEMRHASIYGRYIASLGKDLSAKNQLQSAYQEALSWDGPVEGVLLAFHILLENESLEMQSDVGRWMPCPLFLDIARTVAADEARHIAFGRTWLPMALASLPPEQHEEIFHWLRSLWFETVGEIIGFLRPFDIINGPKPWSRWLEDEWGRRKVLLRNAGLNIISSEIHEVKA